MKIFDKIFLKALEVHAATDPFAGSVKELEKTKLGGPESEFLTGGLGVSLGRTIKGVIAALGVIAVIIIIRAGFHFMFNADNQEKIKAAKQSMLYGVIGLIIILAAYSISTFFFDNLIAQTQ